MWGFAAAAPSFQTIHSGNILPGALGLSQGSDSDPDLSGLLHSLK